MKHAASGLGMALVFAALLHAQLRVPGRVTGQNNLPVDGAQVTVQDPGRKESWEAISDPTGFFQLRLPGPGDYVLKVDREGFYVISERPFTVPVAASGAPPFELHIALDSIHDLRYVAEVQSAAGTADLDRVTPQNTLSIRTLYNVPFPNPNSLRSGLRTTPGVVQDSTGSIHLFGGAEEQAQYSFEGFQLNDPLTGRFDARMSLESVESVDVQASPADADMGRGDAGTMLLRARSGDDEFQYSATEFFPGIALGSGLRVVSWNPRAYVSGPWLKGRAWFFNTAEFQFAHDTVKQLPILQNSANTWHINDLLHNQINLTDKNSLFIGLLWDYQFSPNAGLTPLDPRSTTLRNESGEWFGYAKDQWTFSATSMLELGLAFTTEHSAAIPQGFSPYLITPAGQEGDFYSDSRRDADRLQGIANYYLPAFRLFGKHQLKAGGDILHLDYRQNITRTAVDYLDNSGDVLRSITFVGSGALNRNNDLGSFYMQDSWRPRPWLLIEAGWRADEDRLLSRFNSSPRAGISFSPFGLERIRVSGSYARIIEATNLLLFTRPLDQSTVTNYFDAAGNLIYGPVVSIFTPGQNLQSPRADVWAVGMEAALPKRIQGKIQLLRRRFSQGFNYVSNLPANEQFSAVLAGAPNPGQLTADYVLTNGRQDQYDSAEISLGQPLNRGRFQWLVSYTRSRADSNAVIERNVDEPLSISADTGPLPWDAPNRLVSWGYLPAFRWGKNWAIGYMLDWHTGFPFSVQDDYGQLIGSVDQMRRPEYFELNVFLERTLVVKGYRLAVRGGINNITGHFNPTIINNVAGSPAFLAEYNGQPRALNFQVRLLEHK